MRYDPNRQVQFVDIYTESEGKLSTSSAPKRDNLIEWIPWTRSSATPWYETTACVAQAKRCRGRALPIFGHCSAPQQPFRELVPPCLFPHPQKYLPKWSEPKLFINPAFETASHSTALSGWARLPPVLLLKGLWHQALPTQAVGSLTFCFFFAFLSQAYISSDHSPL